VRCVVCICVVCEMCGVCRVCVLCGNDSICKQTQTHNDPSSTVFGTFVPWQN